MRKNHIFSILLTGFLFNAFYGYGQESMILYYLENVPQSNLLNPAMTPRCNGYFGIPGVNTVYVNLQTDISQKFLLQSTDSGTFSLISKFFDYDKFYSKIGKAMTLRNYDNITPINFGFRGKNGYFTFSLSEKIKANITFPADYFRILDKGIPDGSNFDFSKMGINAQIYQEYAFGYSRNLIKNLRVGARLKILQGFYSLKTNFNTFSLNTGTELWDFKAKGDIYSSIPLQIIKKEDGTIDSVKISDEYSDIDPIDLIKNNLFKFSNFGMATDLGAVYDLNRSWSFSASIIDLGFIRWKKDLNSMHFNGAFQYTGLNISGSNIDSIDNAFSGLLDSINYFDGYAGDEKYFTGLGTAIYLGGQYHVNHYFSAGLLSRSVIDKNYFYQEFNLSANLNLYNVLTTNLNYNVAFSGEQYAGFGLGLRLFPLQLYLMLDNIPLTYTHYIVDDSDGIFAPNDLRSFNIMIGLNLIFGANGYQDHPKIDAYSEL